MNQDLSIRFPHHEPIDIGGHSLSAREIIELVEPYFTEERKAKIASVIQQRTYAVVPVLENIYDRGNVSAVMRSAEAMGYQSVHVIETGERFKSANRVTQGADKWLDVRRWKDTTSCVQHLKSLGYRIFATHLDETAKSIGEIDFTQPAAVVLGNEKDGVSQELLEQCDGRVIIPMQGFVQSFNISVAGAISLYHIFRERERAFGRQGDLSEREKEILTALYYLRSGKNPERLIARLMERKLRS